MFNRIKTRLSSYAYRLANVAHCGFVAPAYDGMQDSVRMHFLYDMTKAYGTAPGAVVEIGVFQGCSTVYLAKAVAFHGKTEVVGLDLFTGTVGWKQTYDTEATARARLDSYGLQHVQLVRGDASKLPWNKPISVLHIDGDHTYAGVSKDIAKFTPHVVPGGIVIFDDYDGDHPDVRQAVRELLATGAWDVVGCNYRQAYGSICLRRVPPTKTAARKKTQIKK